MEPNDLRSVENSKLFDLLEENEAVLLGRKMRAVEIAYKILLANDADLMGAVKRWAEFDLTVVGATNMELVDDFLIDSVFRHLHNYLASVKTLVDITRKVVPKLYEGTEFANEYRRRVEADFGSNPFAQFVQQLRNLFLHERIPRVLASMAEHRSVTLDLADLESWDGWNATARRYIEGVLAQDKAEGQFPVGRLQLIPIVQRYTILVRDFHDWLTARQQDLHREAYEERERIRQEVRRRRDRPQT